MNQPINAFLIVRYEADGNRRVVGSTYSANEARISCEALTNALYNFGSGNVYRVEPNPNVQEVAA